MIKALHHGFGNSPKIHRTTPLTSPFEHKIISHHHSVEDYYCVNFHVIPIMGFRCTCAHTQTSKNILTYTHAHIMIKSSQYEHGHTT